MIAISQIRLDHLAKAFGSRPLAPLRFVALLLNMSEKQLRAHAKAGNIRSVNIGMGVEKPRRMFSLADVAEFVEARSLQSAQQCQSTRARTPRSTGATSPSTVIAFSALRAKRKSEQRAVG
ncbi:hypothetical protein [Hansschlegelia sp. KR7-227]|uniref:hypothetical protein n=1 Tax=Hansschlegelia sp. KR7-227 TaxID=3400914 RepID=UPI003C08BCED